MTDGFVSHVKIIPLISSSTGLFYYFKTQFHSTKTNTES